MMSAGCKRVSGIRQAAQQLSNEPALLDNSRRLWLFLFFFFFLVQAPGTQGDSSGCFSDRKSAGKLFAATNGTSGIGKGEPAPNLGSTLPRTVLPTFSAEFFFKRHCYKLLVALLNLKSFTGDTYPHGYLSKQTLPDDFNVPSSRATYDKAPRINLYVIPGDEFLQKASM